jgi:DNA repair protein RadA/Sms
VKHRFGPTSKLGVFEMTASGLAEVVDASGLFLADRRCGVPGSAVVAAIDGHRPLLVEVQALVTSSPLPAPRRSAQGVDQGRLSLLLAVLQERTGRAFGTFDVYVSVVGGVRLIEPGTDLGTCLALASALAGRPVPPSLGVARSAWAAIRQVGRWRSGWPRLPAWVPAGPRAGPRPADVGGGIELANLADALTAVGSTRQGAAEPKLSGWRPDEVPRAGRSQAAPGTPLRDGLDRIVKAKMGALVAVGDGPTC